MGGIGKSLLNILTLGMVGGPTIPKIPPPLIATGPETPEPGAGIDNEAKAAAAVTADLERKRKGRAATIMSGPEGVLTAPSVQRRQLFGE
jgi:hypothetical protein